MTMVDGSDAFSRVEEYEVKPGDSLTQIAFKFKASQRQIRKINQMLDDSVIAGEILLIPMRDDGIGEDIKVIKQTQDFMITHRFESQSPKS